MTIEYSEDSALRVKHIGDPTHSSRMCFLDTNGDGSGTKDMNGVADTYFIAPEPGEVITIEEIRIVIGDNKGTFLSGLFGSIAALATGCLLRVDQVRGGEASEALDLLDGEPIINNDMLHSLCDVEFVGDFGGGVMTCKYIHHPIALHGNDGEQLVWEVQDNLAGLDYMRVSVKVTNYQNNLS